MRITTLTRLLLIRKALTKQVANYTEPELNILITIWIIGQKHERCSPNILAKYLSKLLRSQRKKNLGQTLKKLQGDGRIRITGQGPGRNIHLSEFGKQFLTELEIKLRTIKPPTL